MSRIDDEALEQMEVSEGTNNQQGTICDNDIDQNRFSLPSVTSDVTSSGKLSEHIDFIDRYFTHYFCDKTKLLFLQHTNALICVVTLSDEHPVLKACKETVRNGTVKTVSKKWIVIKRSKISKNLS